MRNGQHWARDERPLMARGRSKPLHGAYSATGTEETAMNRHERRKAKVSEVRTIPLTAISGFLCAWEGCPAKFQGDMPRGWINLLAYWSKCPELNFLKIPPQDVLRDGVLCPEHARALESHLKDLGRLGSMPSSGTA
jgi:hypothetical protein